MIVALTAEISVLQDQQDMLTRILVARGVATDEEIAYFQPDTAASAARATTRRDLIERVMRIIVADAERAVSAEPRSAERRVGTECVRNCISRRFPYHSQHKTTNH